MAKRAKKERGPIGETVSTVLWAFGIAFFLRTFLFQPFHIPSGSMQPNLLKGDYVITSKLSLGYGKHAASPLPFPVKSGRLFEREPKRGDVLVFKPEGLNKNFIKRLVGLPGDQIQVKDGLLYLNGTQVPVEVLPEGIRMDQYGREHPAKVYQETFDNGNVHPVYDGDSNGREDNTSIFTVPAGYYFMMGDNRDFSADSRVSVASGGASYVPTENLIGRAEFVLLSVNNDFSIKKPWTWLNFRGDRFFEKIP